MRGELCPFDHGNDPVIVQDMASLGFPGNAAAPFGPDRSPASAPPGAVVPVPGNFPIPSTVQPPPPGTGGPPGDPRGKGNQDNPGPPPVSSVGPGPPMGVGGPRMSLPPMPPPGAQQTGIMPPISGIHQPVIRPEGPHPPFGNPFEGVCCIHLYSFTSPDHSIMFYLQTRLSFC